MSTSAPGPHARRPRRRPLIVALAAGGLAVLLWAPSLVATVYAEDDAASAYLARPDRGWRFLYDAVTLSRGARLGSEPGALREAREVWAGAPAVAGSVRLAYLRSPYAVPVPPGGTRPAAGRGVARPRSELSWLVTGSVRGGPSQVIGVVDYASGRVVWDIRPLPAAR